MCPYFGRQGISQVPFHDTRPPNDIWPPNEWKRENNVEPNKMEFRKGVWGYEDCLSHTSQKSRQLTLRAIIQHSSRNTETAQTEKKRPNHWIHWKLQQTQQNCCVERSFGIENVTSLIECTRAFLQPPHGTNNADAWAIE